MKVPEFECPEWGGMEQHLHKISGNRYHIASVTSFKAKYDQTSRALAILGQRAKYWRDQEHGSISYGVMIRRLACEADRLKKLLDAQFAQLTSYMIRYKTSHPQPSLWSDAEMMTLCEYCGACLCAQSAPPRSESCLKPGELDFFKRAVDAIYS